MHAADRCLLNLTTVGDSPQGDSPLIIRRWGQSLRGQSPDNTTLGTVPLGTAPLF